MKTRFLRGCAMALTLSALPFVGGCDQPTAGSSGIVQSASAQAGSSPNDLAAEAMAPSGANGPSDPDMPTPPMSEKTVPTKIKPSAPLAEMIRLANAGVEEEVLLAYAKGSQVAFHLGPDEIIYLTDIGLPDSVVTAMIERDQVLGEQHWATAEEAAQANAEVTNTPVAEAQVPIAAAPTYVNPPDPVPVPEQPPQVVNYNYFYDNLGSYGSWHNVDGYGWCWQPTVVVHNRGWRPYSDRGRWIYTDRGWYWQSDYSWGLTFHYGRWFNHPRRGWCWWPDRTWAPAWVTFRYNDNYCGWAPLPPRTYCDPRIGLTFRGRGVRVGFDFGLDSDCYTFVTWRGFCDSRPWRHRLQPHHTRTVINNTTIVNNIIRGDNNTIINRGIGVEHVTERTRTPVREVALRDAQERRVKGINRTERVERDGGAQASSRMGSRSSLSEQRRSEGQDVAGRGGASGDRNDSISYTRDRRPSDAGRIVGESQEVSRKAPGRGGNDVVERQASPEVARTQGEEGRTARVERNTAPSGALIGDNNEPTRFTPRSAQQSQISQSARETGAERKAPTWTARNQQVETPQTQPAVTQQPEASSSVVRIGRGSSSQPRGQIRVYESPRSSSSSYEQPQAAAPQPSVQQPAAPTHNWSQPVEQRRESSHSPARARNPFEQQSAPRYESPRQSAPSYSAPVNQAPAVPRVQQQQPAPRYERPSAPPPTPAPRVEAPRQESPRQSVRSEPAPRSNDSDRSSPPSSSSSSRGSDSGGSSRGGGGGDRGGGGGGDRGGKGR
jgi:uncharacterized membrane protein YgcG